MEEREKEKEERERERKKERDRRSTNHENFSDIFLFMKEAHKHKMDDNLVILGVMKSAVQLGIDSV